MVCTSTFRVFAAVLDVVPFPSYLRLAVALLGAEHVIGVDVDAESLEVASTNAEDLEAAGAAFGALAIMEVIPKQYKHMVMNIQTRHGGDGATEDDGGRPDHM
ncbi:hypothetical protein POM88_053329 [Heracleum sosnowskyi]|uniref:Uncharacterized protein n=1 Tax=Heracleum sosnowskyi TaxID=360622 RepID=A0AAD8GQJ0_9APIA|nr:hypothetical protein POM88_053329 [Heracleum sosnowskyi]